MKFGSIEDMMRDVEQRISELEGGVTSSFDLLSGYDDDEDTEIDNVVNWLADHEQAYSDFNLFFEDRHGDVSLDEIVGWIAEHDTLCNDFCQRFPEIAREQDLMCSESIMCTDSNTKYADEFCWKINDEIVGSALDVDDVTCVFAKNKFVITVQLANGEEFDFDVPLSDLSCDIDTLSDDLDYVVSEIEAALLSE